MAKYRYRTTEARIARLLREGRGEGHGADYHPWLTVRDLASLGRSHRIPGATTGRLHHLLSDLECSAFLEFDWRPDVYDIREQFPLDREETRWLSRNAGFRHPADRGVDIVMTTDFLLDRSGGARAVTVKPAKLLGDLRTVAKLEIERLYWSSRQVRMTILTEREFKTQRTLNLGTINGARSLDGLDCPTGHWEDRCSVVLAAIERRPDCTIAELGRDLEARRGWESGAMLFAVWHMAAHRILSFDIEKPLTGLSRVGELSILDGQP